MFCTTCGHSITLTQKRCPNCGAISGEREPDGTMPLVRHPNPADSPASLVIATAPAPPLAVIPPVPRPAPETMVTGPRSFLFATLPVTRLENPMTASMLGGTVALALGLILAPIAVSLWFWGLHVAAFGLSLHAGSLSLPAMQLLALAQGIPLSVSGNATLSLGFLGDWDIGGEAAGRLTAGFLFLVPAVALIAGGYVTAARSSAASLAHRAGRGASIAPYYAVLLAVAAQWLGSTGISGGILGRALPK